MSFVGYDFKKEKNTGMEEYIMGGGSSSGSDDEEP